jgi:hypothetical protein
MKINLEKSGILVTSAHGNYKTGLREELGGIPICKQYKYLGVNIRYNYDLSMNAEKEKIKKAKQRASGITSLFAESRDVRT